MEQGGRQPPQGMGLSLCWGMRVGAGWLPGAAQAAKAGETLPLPGPGPAAPPSPALTEGPSPESEEVDGLASVKLVSTVEL